jgi:hypothetical protein
MGFPISNFGSLEKTRRFRPHWEFGTLVIFGTTGTFWDHWWMIVQSF